MSELWKSNWTETQRHFLDWWAHRGLVLGMWGAPKAATPRGELPDPGPPPLVEAYTDPELRARLNEFGLARCDFPADCLPLANADIGPGSLCLFIGGEPQFTPQSVWFHPSLRDVEEPGILPPLKFDPDNRWWKLTEATLRAHVRRADGRYFAACPDLVENLDILSALRDPQTTMMDMILRPEWVHEKLAEINQVFFEAYQRIHDIIKLPDGSSCFGAFVLWGPGKTVKVQCDAAAMISPAMFETFVVPPLAEQCAWLDHSMFHLDGIQCLDKLDALLAIEWTPQAGIEQGGSPRWYPLYKRILEAGKSVQVVGAAPDQIIPLLDAVGGKGVYIMTGFKDRGEAETIMEKAEAYR